jgi:PKD repeat protein
MLSICSIFSKAIFAQSTINPQGEKCLSEIMFQEAALKDPSLITKRAEIDKFAQEYAKKQSSQRKASVAPRIIPVVFHVIHECGPENISREQCLDQIRVLNLDYRRKNADTTNTPAHFDSLAADCNIEFRLASIDPTGKPTEGINRVYSHLTNNARDNVKALSYWDSKKYLNIWVVKTIDPQGLTTGFVLGYAQFPGSGSPLTDGVEIRADWIGTIEDSHSLGRTATHEIGHWLNLRHIWGDAQCGNDMVTDTPTQFGANESICPTYPSITKCPSNGNPDNRPYGDMFMDYMDYVNDNCMNMFSKGQSIRMDATLAGTRSQIISQANLVATGTDDAAVQGIGVPRPYICGQNIVACAGSAVIFSASIYNGIANTYNWTFQGASPSTSTSASPSVQYAIPGTYSISLKTTNAAGADSVLKNQYVTITANTAIPNATFTDSYESGLSKGWSVLNPDNDIVKWSISNTVAHTGTNSVKINNYNTVASAQGNLDALISPPIDFTGVTSPKLIYSSSYAYRSSTVPTDALKIYFSTDCGKTWTIRSSFLASSLLSGGIVSNNYAPNANSQWKQFTISFPSLANVPSALIKFEFTAGAGGNNLYLDDISTTGSAVGIEDITPATINLSIVPNPTESTSLLSFELTKQQQVSVKIYDLLGREIEVLADEKLNEGNHSFEISKLTNKGIYFVKIMIDNASFTQKLILN